MKTKIYKLLSIILALAILATTSLAITGIITVSAEDATTERVYPENSYFISSKGKTVPTTGRPAGYGTLETPVKTFADVTKLIKADGYGADDTVYVFIKSGEQVQWKDLATDDSSNSQPDPVAYTCNLILDSTNPEVKGTLYEYDYLDFPGNMVVKNVNFKISYMYGCARLGHNTVVFDEGSVVSFPEFFIGAKNAPTTYNKEFNLEIKGEFTTNKFFLMSNFRSGTYEKDINILVDNANAVVPIYLTGYRAENKFTFNGNINITVKNAKSLTIADHQGVSVFNGALQLLVSDKVKLPYAVNTNFNNYNFAGGKWLITYAAPDDFVQLTDKAGKYNIKDGAKAYIRQLGGKLITEKSGVVDLSSKSGAYTISNKTIDELLDESHKMLYFKGVGGTNYVYTRAEVVPGETYRLEYSIYSGRFEDSFPTCREDGDRKVIGDDMKIISSKEYKNYYKVVAEITIPETYYDFEKNKNNLAFFGVSLPTSATGVIFDWVVYNVKDSSKTNLLRNSNFYSGLDQIALNYDFWGAVYTDERGGSGLHEWTNGVAELKIMPVSSKFIDELIYLADPDDGIWWKPEDYVDEVYEAYGKAAGIFMDQDGKPLKGYKFMLVSEDKTYTATTNSKGEFSFGEVLSGIYDLFILNGNKKVQTEYSDFIAQYDYVKFTVKSDITDLLNVPEEPIIDESPVEEEIEEVIPTGNYTATVYTPMLEIVPDLPLTLRGIGDVVTDANGSFAFANIPVGTYDLFTVLDDGSEYVIAQVEILENCDVSARLKFAPTIATDGDTNNNGWIIWVIVASSVALVIVAGLIFFLVFKGKKAAKVA